MALYTGDRAWDLDVRATPCARRDAMGRNRSGRPDHGRIAREAHQRASDTERSAADADQTAADADQIASDADQTASDADQAASERDEDDAASDQRAADQEQAISDQHPPPQADTAGRDAWVRARADRVAIRVHRLATHGARTETGRARANTSAERDVTAAARDEVARIRDEGSAALERSIDASDAPLAKKLELIRVRAAADRLQAAADRERAAADRERAAGDRAEASTHRVRLEADLQSAHLDALTGALRREIGWLTLGHEIERALRGDGRFVIAFVDVDDLKGVNDRHGHAAGDGVLQTLVWVMRANLRPYDPVVRYGGDEFVCGLGATDLDDVARRFEMIGRAVQDDVGVGISVGLAALARGETLDELTARADAALLDARSGRGP